MQTQSIIVILKDREILPYYTPFRPVSSSAKLMGHNCHMHVSELSSPALHAAAGAHSAFYRALSACRNRLCTHGDTIESPNAFPYHQHCGSPTVVCLFMGDRFPLCLDSDLEFFLSVMVDSKVLSSSAFEDRVLMQPSFIMC